MTTVELRKLLTHDADRGGVPVRLLSARWLLEFFQAEGHEGAPVRAASRGVG